MGRVAPAQLDLLCDMPGEPADRDWENMAKDRQDTIQQNDSKPLENTQKYNTATVGALISKITHRFNTSTT